MAHGKRSAVPPWSPSRKEIATPEADGVGVLGSAQRPEAEGRVPCSANFGNPAVMVTTAFRQQPAEDRWLCDPAFRTG